MKPFSDSRFWQALGVNAVPVTGVFFGGWSTATALVVYWSETLMAAVFTAALIAVHRKVTRKKGHYRDQWEKPPRRAIEHAERAEPRRHFRTFLSGFLVGSLSFTVGLGLFLALLLATVLDGSTDVPPSRPACCGWRWRGPRASAGTRSASVIGPSPGFGTRPTTCWGGLS